MTSTSKAYGQLLLIGAGGHGRVVADAAEALGWQDVAFLDDRWPALERNGVWPVIGALAALPGLTSQYSHALVCIGANRARLTLHGQLVKLGYSVPSLIHPAATVSRHCILGAGTVVLAGAVISPFALVGDAVIINTGSSVDHDSIVSDGVHISPGARLSGGVQVGACSWIGVGSVIREYIAVGRDVMVGAGAAVVSNLPDGIRAIGVPARAR